MINLSYIYTIENNIDGHPCVDMSSISFHGAVNVIFFCRWGTEKAQVAHQLEEKVAGRRGLGGENATGESHTAVNGKTSTGNIAIIAKAMTGNPLPPTLI